MVNDSYFRFDDDNKMMHTLTIITGEDDTQPHVLNKISTALDNPMQLQSMDDLHHNTMYLPNKQNTNTQTIYLYMHTDMM